MRLINIKRDNSNSFKYSILLYLYYYNSKINHNRPTEINKQRDPHIPIKFNKSNDVIQFEHDNPLIDLLIIDNNNKPLFFTRNNANIKVAIIKLNDYRYSLCKPELDCFNNNINQINKINTNTNTNTNNRKKYVLADKIKEKLRLDLKYIM